MDGIGHDVECNTVDTNNIVASMSIWDTFNTNDCDYFGKNKFNPHFPKNILKVDIIVIIQYIK